MSTTNEAKPFHFTVEYRPKDRPSLTLSLKHKDGTDLQRTSSNLSSAIIDDCLVSSVRAEISRRCGVDLPAKPTGDERHVAGRLRREVSRARRVLQSLVGQKIGEEADEDEDACEWDWERVRPFNAEHCLSIELDDVRVQLEMNLSSEVVGDACAGAYRTAILEPLRDMMEEANLSLQEGVKERGVVVVLTGLKLPGVMEFLAKALHGLKYPPSNNEEQALSMEDVNSHDMRDGRAMAIGETGTSCEVDKKIFFDNSFAAIVDNTDSWKFYYEMSVPDFTGSLGACLHAMTHSDEEDYFTDQSFYDSEDEDY